MTVNNKNKTCDNSMYKNIELSRVDSFVVGKL